MDDEVGDLSAASGSSAIIGRCRGVAASEGIRGGSIDLDVVVGVAGDEFIDGDLAFARRGELDPEVAVLANDVGNDFASSDFVEDVGGVGINTHGVAPASFVENIGGVGRGAGRVERISVIDRRGAFDQDVAVLVELRSRDGSAIQGSGGDGLTET